MSAINAVVNDRQWISPGVRKAIPTQLCRGEERSSELSAREQDVVVLVSRGLTSGQIADQLCLSRAQSVSVPKGSPAVKY